MAKEISIGDEVWVHGFVDEIRRDVIIIRNDGGYFGTVAEEIGYCDDYEDLTDTPQTERSACGTCYVYNSGIPCGVDPSVCKREVTDTPQTEAVVKPYKPTNREILDAIENSDCPWK